MTYREHIVDIFQMSQSVLQEYTALCIRAHSGNEIDLELLKECDEKFREYNQLLRKHHELLVKVTKREIKLERFVPNAEDEVLP
jgi:hypothetical protein